MSSDSVEDPSHKTTAPGEPHGWTRLASDPLVLVRSYSFGGSAANALLVGLPGGKLLAVSPACGMTADELKALSAYGEVVALLENNGLHHLGLPPWRAAFPAAVAYAAPRAAARIRKKAKHPGPLEPLEALAPLLGENVSVVAVPGDKIGDVLVRVRTDKGTVLYLSDLVANITRLPKGWFARLPFRLTNSGPGLQLFGLFFMFFVADRNAAIRCVIQEVESNPPAIVVPAHGDVLARDGVHQSLLDVLQAALQR